MQFPRNKLFFLPQQSFSTIRLLITIVQFKIEAIAHHMRPETDRFSTVIDNS